MATITLTYPDGEKDRILNSFCAQHNYQETILDAEGQNILNPQTKAQFFKAKVAEFVKQSVLAYEADQAETAAREIALSTPPTIS